MTEPTLTFSDQLADLCLETANVWFDGLKPTPQNAVPVPFWELDRRAFEAELGSGLAHTWIHNCSYVYLLESAYELAAIGALLRTRTTQASIYPLVRSVIERIGVVNWILSADATHRQRALRGSIAYVVSINPYVKGLKALKAEAKFQRENEDQQVFIEASIAGWFGEPTQPTDPATSSPTTDRTKWIYEEESYPGFNKLCKMSLERSNLTRSLASSVYDVLSGFTHPNIFFGREHLLAIDGRMTLDSDDPELEKVVRFATGALGEGLKRWATYYESDQDAVIARVDALSDRLDAITVILPK
jgi:hypothetical protein